MYAPQGILYLLVRVERTDGQPLLRAEAAAPEALHALAAVIERWDYHRDGVPRITVEAL